MSPEDEKDEDLDADDPQEEEPVVEIDGEKIPVKDAVDAYKNRRDWQKASTQRDQELADARRQLTEITSKVIDKLGDKDDRQEADQSEDEFLSRLDNLPDPITEKEAFQRELKETFKSVRSWAKEQAESLANEQTAAAKKDFETQLESKTIQDQVVAGNYRTLDERLAELVPGISKTDRAKVEAEIRGYHGPNHGTWVNLANGKRVFQYATASVDMAVRALGVKGKAAPRRVVNEESEVLSEPADNAPLADKLNYLRSLSEDRVVEKFSRMSQKDKDELYNIHIQGYKR